MARPLRIEYSGAVYHITSRGNEKRPVFKDDPDREIFLKTLTHVNERYNWICHANTSLGSKHISGVNISGVRSFFLKFQEDFDIVPSWPVPSA